VCSGESPSARAGSGDSGWSSSFGFAMILLFTMGGRTGNQLFQIAHALSRRNRKEWLVSVGFGKTRSFLAGPCRTRWLNIEGGLFRVLIEEFLQPFLYRFLVRTGIIASDYENLNTYEIQPGRIRRFRIMKGYFQSSERQAPDLQRIMCIDKSLTARARLAAAASGGNRLVFIHIRRSDFEGVRIEGQGVLLPEKYYLDAVRELRQGFPRLFYIIMGDDPDYAEQLFKDLNPKYISRLSMEEDLALMSLCEGGVLSNSTFAWWGAFFSTSRIGYIAPMYWSGWNVKKWLPPELRGSFVTKYIDVGST
jgi:hypothetical protein